MKKLLFLASLFAAAAFSSCSKHDSVETPVPPDPVVVPEPQPLAIAFAEGNSLEFDVDETKIVHYTITGGSANNVVKVEMQNPDGAYALSTTSASATEGTIKITAKVPTDNRVIVTVSDGTRTIMAAIDVTVIIRASFDGKTIVVETPGTLSQLLADYDKTTITELTVIGNLNRSDIYTLDNLPNLAILDMEHVNLEVLSNTAFQNNTSLTSVKLPLTLKTIGDSAFDGCNNLTSVYITDIAKWCTINFGAEGNPLIYAHNLYLNGELVTELVIPDSVTSIEAYAFSGYSSLTSVTIGNSVTTIGGYAFYGCSSLTSIYCMAQTPPAIGSSTFAYMSYTLYVPTGCKEAYTTANWMNAKEIIEMDF